MRAEFATDSFRKLVCIGNTHISFSFGMGLLTAKFSIICKLSLQTKLAASPHLSAKPIEICGFRASAHPDEVGLPMNSFSRLVSAERPSSLHREAEGLNGLSPTCGVLNCLNKEKIHNVGSLLIQC